MNKKIKELRELVQKLRAEINLSVGDELKEKVEAVINSMQQEINKLKSLKNKL